MLCFTHLANAHRAQAEVTPTDAAEDNGEDDDHRRGITSREPQSQTSNRTHTKGKGEGVNPPYQIRDHTSEESPEERTSIRNGENLKPEGGGVTMCYHVRGNIREWDKDAPFHKKDTKSDQRERHVFKDRQVRAYFLEAADFLAGQPAVHEDIGYHEEEYEDESNTPGCPGKTD